MMEKFQKLFGPNKMQSPSGSSEMPFSAAQAQEDAATRRVRNRHRFYGMLVVLAICLGVAPWVMRPNMEFTKSIAEIDIPSIPKLNDAARVVLQPKNSVTLPSVEASAKKKEAAVKKVTPLKAVKTDAKSTEVKKTKPLAKTTKTEVKPKKEAKPPVAQKSTKADTKTVAVSKSQASATSKTNTKIVAGKAYFIQVMAANTPAAAKAGANKLRALGLPVYVETTKRGGNTFWRVRAGRFGTYAEARRALDKLELNGVTNLGVMSEKLAGK